MFKHLKFPREKNVLGRQVKGFSIVELIISIAIIGILSSVIVYNQRQFDESIKLDNIAYELSLAIKSAQSQAVNSTASNDFTGGRGIRAVSLGQLSNNQVNFKFFNDLSKDFALNTSEVSSVRDYNLSNPFQLRDYCVILINVSGSNTKICKKQSNPVIVFDLAFHRPFLTPGFYVTDSAGIKYPNSNNKVKLIYYQVGLSAGSAERYVVVTAAGSIYVTKNLPT